MYCVISFHRVLRLHFLSFRIIFYLIFKDNGKGIIHLFILLIDLNVGAFLFRIHRTWCEKLYSAWCRECCLEKECYFDLVKSSRLQHEESQLKKWRVMEMDRMIWSEMRLYTIGKISEELIFSFSIDCISIFFSLTVYKYFVVTALYSFLFNKQC